MQLIISKLRRQLSKHFFTTLTVISTCVVLLIYSGYEILSRSHSASLNLTIAQQIDLGQSFRDLGVDGSIVIYDKNNDRFYEHNPSRNTTAFFPASTFKIFNSLVAIETGVIKDEHEIIQWPGSTDTTL